MKSYFRYLTTDQAMRYLYLASYHLLLAIRLVHHDRGLPLPPSLFHDDGGNGKIKIALRNAAVKVRHPAPDNLVQTMTAKYPSHLLSPIMDKLTGPSRTYSRRAYACHPTWTYCAAAAAQMSPKIMSDMTFNSPAMEANLSKCIMVGNAGSQDPAEVSYDASPPCEHILSLNMCLLDAIHCFYIRALAALPLPAAGAGNDDSTMCRSRLLRSLLVSGHCFGPLDPVSNIIVNAVWYNVTHPHLLPMDNDEVELPQDISDTGDISRLASHSLCGLVALLCAINGAPLSKHDAIEYLWFRQCDLTEELQQTVMTKKNPYDAATKASKQYTMLGKFLKSFSGKKLDSLRCLLESIHDDSRCVISNANWEKLNTMIKEQLYLVLDRRRKNLYYLHGPQDFVAIRDSAYVSQQRFIRRKLEQLLDMYSRQHSWELRYKLDLVCGVEESNPHYPRCYHANFLASIEPDDDRKTAPIPVRTRELFFAEFWDEQPGRFDCKPICCPIQDYNSFVGRCPFCGEASKIVHPPCASGSHPNHGDAASTIPDYKADAAIHMYDSV
uniref:Uncharacterized protein n=1 Tax=Leersia perrieri TaxID=77586 RepID=A0A0D9XYH9_9ORYZ